MRIGIDMFGDQSPSRQRGIGRYTRELVSHLVESFPQHEFFLYYYLGLPGPDAAPSGRLTLRTVDVPHGSQPLRYAPDRLAWQNPDELDALLITNPFEAYQGYQPPRLPVPRLTVAAVFYDLIPFLFPGRYLENAEVARAYLGAIRAVHPYDVVLAISEATRLDVVRLLKIPADRVVTIGAASDGTYFCPDRRMPPPLGVANRLRSLGIHEPFVFSLSGMDDRKNFMGLLAAYAQLPEHLRTTHQLVLTSLVSESEERRLREAARERGIDGRLVLTNFLDDETIRLLYQRCAAFVFPSRYEGFGLPILEAMHCAAPVLAGRNSSQPEVVGDAGLLAHVDDPADLAGQLAAVLQDSSLAESLREKGPQRAATFSWKFTAQRAMAAIEAAARRPNRRADFGRRSLDKPRLAVFSTLPPCRSGVADYSVNLLDALREHYSIDVYHDPRLLPDVAIQRDDIAYRDARMFARFHQVLNYRRALYHIGNSERHGFIYDALLRHPGVVVLHDVDVAMSRRVFDLARRVIVHDRWNTQQLRELYPDCTKVLHQVPHGAAVQHISETRRKAIRSDFNLSREALVFGCFGILHEKKCVYEVIDAFARLATDHPSATLLFVGADQTHGGARRKVSSLRLEPRVRFFDYVPLEAFLQLAAITDIGINLRRPPTNGETSGSLIHLLSAGVPCIVTDVGTFASLPNDVVRKIPWRDIEHGCLHEEFRRLANDSLLRQRIGHEATKHIQETCNWRRVAELYAEVIEEASKEATKDVPSGLPSQSTESTGQAAA